MIDLIETLTVATVLALAFVVIAMVVLGMVGVLSGSRFVVGCRQCGRWQLDLSGRGNRPTCMHCAHPERFGWEPALLHPHRRPSGRKD
jgi:Zinc-ribbon containing domain